ncbi:MAG TPA: hypothetical protein VMN37_09975 [Gemmatimonadales bacterium]|nr:hypothetical protein [Gemmatimonadales bacterium]
MADDAAVVPEPSPVESMGLHGPRMAARVRQALYGVPAAQLAHAHARIRDGSVARNLDYFHDGARETIRVLPCPIAMLQEEIEYLHRVTRTLHQALLRIPDLYLEDPQVRDLLQLAPEEDRWLRECWTPAHRERNPVFDRLDALVDFTGPVWKETLKFVEPNLTGVGGLHLVPSVEEVVEEVMVPLIVAQDPGLRLRRLPDAREILFRALAGHLAAIGRPGGCICLVEPKYELEGIDEQRRLVEWFQRRYRIDVLHADPSELRLAGGEVYYEDLRVDLVYRDYSVQDLIDLEADGVDVEPMRRLFRENRVMSSIGAELDHKACWEVLTDPGIAERYFGEEERRVFQRHVLWTRVVGQRRTLLPNGESGDLLEYARREHETLVLKPSRGYGGDGVLLGHTVDAGEWSAALDAALADEERWVLQRLAPIPVVEVPTLAADGSLHPETFYHVMGFASGPDSLAILARASQRQVVNVAQRGGMCAVMVVEELSTNQRP